MHIAMAGEYTIRKYNAETGRLVQELGPFHNTITDIGLNRAGTGSPVIYCYVGTGTTPANISNTTMGNRIATTSTVQTNGSTSSTTPYWFQYSRTFRFAAGAAAGNLTEVGVGWGDSTVTTNYLWSRELTVDGSGNPVTITVLSNEFLDVTYSLRYYPNTSDFTGSFMIGATSYSYTGRIALIGSANVNFNGAINGLSTQTFYGGAGCALGPITGNITGASGSSGDSGTVTVAPYVANSLKRNSSCSYSLAQANVAGGIKAFTLQFAGASMITTQYQILLNSVIAKDNTKTMTLNFENSWARYTP